MASGAAKVALFDAFASVAQALGSGRRAEIVDLLAQGERSVEEIANEISQSVSNTSQHLQVLARTGLVRSRREGTRVFYRFASERVGDLWATVRDVAVRHVAEVNQLADEYLGERDGVEHISAVELQERLARGDVVVLDVRPELEYRAGHIPGVRLRHAREARGRRPARRPRRRLPRYSNRAGRADRGGLRYARASRPPLRPAGARRAHGRDGLPAGRHRSRVRTRRARRRRHGRSEERRVGKECRSRWSPYH